MGTDFIRKRLAELEMSQADLARQLTLQGKSVTRATVTHWLSGRNNPPIEDSEFRLALASALELDVNELMAGMGYIVFDDHRSREALRAADIIDRLPPDKRDLALGILEQFLEHV